MASNFPTSLDSFSDPTGSDKLNSPAHATQHANKNDALEKIEAKVGIDSSAVATSHDYKLTKSEIEHNTDGTHGAVNADSVASAAAVSGTTGTFSTSVTTPIVTATGAFPKVHGIKDLGTVGATETVNWVSGDRQKMTMDVNLAITFSNAAEGQTLTLYMLQDGSGTNTITFNDTIVWANDATPPWSTTADKMNIAVITYMGGAYYGVGNKFA